MLVAAALELIVALLVLAVQVAVELEELLPVGQEQQEQPIPEVVAVVLDLTWVAGQLAVQV